MNEELKIIISAQIAEAQQNLSKIQKELDEVGSQGEKNSKKFSEAFKKMGEATKKAFKVVGAALAAVGTAAVGAITTITKGVGEVAAFGDNIDKMSQKMGMSAQAYQEWDFILQHCGSSMDSMKASMKTLATAAETGSDAFAALGITQKDIASMSQEELFGATISALQKVEDETQRTYLAGKLLGKGATELGPLLNTSAEDTEAMRQQIHELGGVMSDEAVKSAAAFQDSLQNLQVAFGGLKNNLLGEFMPAITTVMDGLSAIFGGGEGGIAMVGEGIEQFIAQLTNGLPQFLTLAQEIVFSLLDAIVANLPQVLDMGIQLLTALIQGVLDCLPQLVSVVVGALPMITEALLNALPLLIECVFSLVTSILEQLGTLLPEIVVQVVAILPQIISSIIDNIPVLLQAAIEFLLAIVDAIPEIIPVLIEALPQIIESVINGLIDAYPVLIQGALQLFMAIVQAIPKIIPDLLGAIGDMIGTLLKTLVSRFDDVGSAIGDALGGSIKAAIQLVLSSAITIINGFIGAINLAIGVINAIPGVEISKLKKLDVPKLAEGGIATGDTLAHIGEGGYREAVLPLDRNTEWMDMLAARLNEKMGGGAPIVLNVDGKTFARTAISTINANTRQTGRLGLNII